MTLRTCYYFSPNELDQNIATKWSCQSVMRHQQLCIVAAAAAAAAAVLLLVQLIACNSA